MKTQKELYRQQDGMVAIVVTILLMTIISLIVLGFSQVTRREQRQALDSQLATQAFYAAESGINLGRKNITNFLAAPKTNCTGSGLNYDVDAAKGVKITCLLVDTQLTNLSYQLSPLRSQASLIDTSPQATSDIIINWQTNGAGLNPAAGCNFSVNMTVTDWKARCSQPMLRIDLVRLDGTTATNWSNDQFSAFFHPLRSNYTPIDPDPSDPNNPQNRKTSTVDITEANSVATIGKKFLINCDATTNSEKTNTCKVKITGLNGTKYGIRLMSIYWDADVTITNSAGSVFKNGQAVIDSTAVAQDVSHRIQVRVPLTGGSNNNSAINQQPDFAIFSGDGLCKQYRIRTNNYTGAPAGYTPTSNLNNDGGADCRVRDGSTNSVVSGW